MASAPVKPRKRVARCFFATPVTDAFAAARAAIDRRFEVFASTATSVSFRWRHTKTIAGPDFRLEPCKLADARRYMYPRHRRAIAEHDPTLTGCLVLSFDDLGHVLDEANGLIEAQGVIAKATRGPVFLAWNKTLIDSID